MRCPAFYASWGGYMKRFVLKNRRDWIYCAVMLVVCVALCFLPEYSYTEYGAIPRERVRVLEVDNSQLMPLGIVYSGVQYCEVEIISGEHAGQTCHGSNYMNSALDKDKLFEVGDEALAMIQGDANTLSATLIDHYRLTSEGWLFGLFALLLMLFGGITGCGALISLLASVLVVWKVLVPALLNGMDPIWTSLAVVLALTVMIDTLVTGFTRKTLVALVGSLAGTLVTCALSVVFGNMLRLDGGSMNYVVPLLMQSTITIDIRELFFSMAFIANSGALMDLSMDIASACGEICVHRPDISRRALVKSGFAVGRNVIGTMTTTLMLAYSGSYLTLMLFFAGQGTPVIDILNLKYVAGEILITLVGSFGLVTVAPFTALAAGALYRGRRRGKATGAQKPAGASAQSDATHVAAEP